MHIHIDPFRPYRGRICLNHGLAVEILRCTHRFWYTYKHLLEVNQRRDSDIGDLQKIMKNMKHLPDEKRKKTEQEKLVVLARVKEDMSVGTKDIETMLKNLERIIRDDQTFLYRFVKELRKLYFRLRHIGRTNMSVSDHRLYSAQEHLFRLMHHMAEMQKHAWTISKAHSRDAFKFEEISFHSNWREKTRIRTQTLELDHKRNRIEELERMVYRLGRATTQEDITRIHKRLTDLLTLYHDEMTDLEHILHESDILLRRTEKLFKAIEREVHRLGFADKKTVKDVNRKVSHCAKVFRKLVYRVERISRREYMDINSIVSRIPPPAQTAPKQ